MRCRKDQFLVIVREDVVADNYSNGTRGAGRIRLLVIVREDVVAGNSSNGIPGAERISFW